MVCGPNLASGPEKGGRLDKRPAQNSLRLLPSGPDRIGEEPVHRQPPGAIYGFGRKKRKGEHSAWAKSIDWRAAKRLICVIWLQRLTRAGIGNIMLR